MVLTKEELIGGLKHEAHVLGHLVSKIDRSKIDYRPTATQRSTLELLQYLIMMGPTLLEIMKSAGVGPASLEPWPKAESAAKAMNFDEVVAEIGKLGDRYVTLLKDWTDEDFRGQIEMFGMKSTRGSLIVSLILGGHAAYRTQLFCYLKACGRTELGTMDLWAGVDSAAVPA